MSVTLNWSNEQNDLEITGARIAVMEKLLRLAAQTEGVEDGEVSLSFVDDETIRGLNRDYRGLDKPTDVLSFPMEDAEEADEEALALEGLEPDDDEWEEETIPHLLGDVIISVPTALRQSEEYGHSIERELGFLFVHGFLHLLGYDHDTPEAERDMFARQEAILLQAGLER